MGVRTSSVPGTASSSLHLSPVLLAARLQVTVTVSVKRGSAAALITTVREQHPRSETTRASSKHIQEKNLDTNVIQEMNFKAFITMGVRTSSMPGTASSSLHLSPGAHPSS